MLYSKLDFSNTVPRRLGRIPASICQASELAAFFFFKSVASHRKFKENMVLENVAWDTTKVGLHNWQPLIYCIKICSCPMSHSSLEDCTLETGLRHINDEASGLHMDVLW